MSGTSSPGARRIDGKAIAFKVLQQVGSAVRTLTVSGLRPPGFAVVLVGSDPAARSHARRKRSACEQAGMHSVTHDLPATSSEAELLGLIDALNEDAAIDGILLQFPLPAHIRPGAVLEAIDPAKDIDGLHPYNIGRLLQRKPVLHPCTPYAVIKLIEHTGVSPKGLDALVVGDSDILGRPMALELLLAGATTTICHADTRDVREHVARAELLVATAGRALMLRGDWIRPGAIVIDAGLNRLADGKLVGDVEFDGAAQRASWITPVPGSVGPMTIAMLLRNTLEASQRRQGFRIDG
ncbi:MAG TPA: bifunctional methylenetetrahydrofolate dehydrogenase/methenyltetrahydrofolate cyclohydrolase FolD [Steroidobacteraceae bacterium]|nr:bifunctional methylenetetrahydrofolate dehydrogenase/methenyltetrahydrofolate cyclohydrolase FolD [Steroidobacteraceae bacterium]